jgi:hypothetical protein
LLLSQLDRREDPSWKWLAMERSTVELIEEKIHDGNGLQWKGVALT